MNGRLRFERSPGGGWARLPRLDALGLRHGFSCRDLDGPGGPAATLAVALGIAAIPRARLRQRHTDRVHDASAGVGPGEPPVGDALIAGKPGVALTVATADCVPLLLLDETLGAFAAVHAGWRGTRAGILPRTVEAMQRRFGSDPAHLTVGIGPCIRACCYEVGDEVRDGFAAAWSASDRWFAPGPARRPHLDLAAANRDQAVSAGVSAGKVLDSGCCTRCRNDLFFSYRAEGPGAGRILTLAALPLPPSAGSG
ncbi:MAG: peptidoglycan editing factor PgeF [Acidobacteriota bacterium]|jgi:YfiH family protein